MVTSESSARRDCRTRVPLRRGRRGDCASSGTSRRRQRRQCDGSWRKASWAAYYTRLDARAGRAGRLAPRLRDRHFSLRRSAVRRSPTSTVRTTLPVTWRPPSASARRPRARAGTSPRCAASACPRRTSRPAAASTRRSAAGSRRAKSPQNTPTIEQPFSSVRFSGIFGISPAAKPTTSRRPRQAIERSAGSVYAPPTGS